MKIVTLQDSWEGGMRPDVPRLRMPPSVTGYIHNALIAPVGRVTTPATRMAHYAVTRRPGFSYATEDIALVNATSSKIVGGAYHYLEERVYFIDEDGDYFSASVSSDFVSDHGSLGGAISGPCAYFNDKIIVPMLSGAPVAISSGGTDAVITGSPPTQIDSACAHKGRLWLALSSSPRVYASEVLNQNSWDTGTTGRWYDTTYNVARLASVQAGLLCFSKNAVEILRGNTPGGAGITGDLTLHTVSNKGIQNAYGVTVIDELCYFCNYGGVFYTDGNQVYDLGREFGVAKYIEGILFSASALGRLPILHALNDKLLMTFSAASDDAQATGIVFDLKQRAASSISGINTNSSWHALTDEGFYTWGGSNSVARGINISSIFGAGTTSTSYKAADANSADITTVIDTHIDKLDGTFQLKNVSAFYINYQLDDVVAGTDYVEVQFVTEDDETYTTIESSLPDTSNDFGRHKIDMSKEARAIGVRIKCYGQVNFMLHSVEVAFDTMEKSR